MWHYTFQRPYDLNSEEGLIRYKIFKSNIKSIQKHNSENNTWKQGLGPFTDLTWEEFEKNNLGTLSDYSNVQIDRNIVSNENIQEAVDINQGVDWSYVYKWIKQQYCSACWSFATVGTIEAHNTIQNKEAVVLSEQHLIDCDFNSLGCRGGIMVKAFEFIYYYGLIKDADYPYRGFDDSYQKRCESSNKRPHVRTGRVIACNPNFNLPCNENQVASLITKGPYATDIEVSDGLQHYKNGDWLPSFCNKINHSVIVVQVLPTKVKIRNSWGPKFGQGGYNYISRYIPGTYLKACGALSIGAIPESVSKY